MAEKPGIPDRFFERAALWIAVMAAAALLAAGPGSRFGWWPFGTGFSIMRYGFYGGVISLLLLIFYILAPDV